MNTRKSIFFRSEGSALPVALFSLLIMSVTGLSLALTASRETSSTRNELLANQAYYAAESGIEEALFVLRGNKCPLDSTDNCANASLNANQISLEIATTKSSSNLSTDTVTYPRLSRWLSYSNTGEDGLVSLNPDQPARNRLGYRLRLQKIGSIIEIASTGVAPLGAQRTLRMRIANATSSFSEANLLTANGQGLFLPSVISMLGQNPNGTAGNSASHSLNGMDCVGSDEKPILGAVGTANAQHVWDNSFKGNKADTFDSNLPQTATSGVAVDISTPDPTRNVTGQVPFDNSATKAEAFINSLLPVAHTVVGQGGTLPSGALGTTTAPKIVVVKDDLSLTGSGAGILVVTGELTLKGNFSYDGIILVLGDGIVRRNGGGNGEIRGGILVGAYSPGSPTFNLSPIFDTNGGGNSLIRYCSDSIQKALAAIPGFKVQSIAED